MNSHRPDLTDDEIDAICAGLTQHAAKIRYLKRLGLRVDRRPNGRPLIARAEWDRKFGSATQQQDAPLPQQPTSTAPRWRVAAA